MRYALGEFESRLAAFHANGNNLSGIARLAARILSLEYCAIHIYGEGLKCTQMSGTSDSIVDSPTQLMQLVQEQAKGVRYLPISCGSTNVGSLVVKAPGLSARELAGLAALIGKKLFRWDAVVASL